MSSIPIEPGRLHGRFPAHPHRGFETVTYMLDGHMRHEDHLGNRGGPRPRRRAVDDGGARQSSIPRSAAERRPHARLPAVAQSSVEGKNEAGRLYRDIPAGEIPQVLLPQGGEVKVIAGTLALDGASTSGPVNGGGAKLSTDPLYLDVRLPAGAVFSAPVRGGLQCVPVYL